MDEKSKRKEYNNNRKIKVNEPIIAQANRIAQAITGNTSQIYEGISNLGFKSQKAVLFDWIASLR